MGRNCNRFVLVLLGFTTLSQVAARAQTDVALSAYRAFNTSTTGNGTVQVPTDSIGGMFELRHITSPIIGYELTYAFNPDNQSLSPEVGACTYECGNPPEKITTRAHEVALDWVVSKKFGSLRPFAVGGLGFFIAVPSGDLYDLNTIVRPAFVIGGGVDWDFAARFGLRFQYRDNLYKTPNITGIYYTTGVYTQTAEPMGGAFFRF